MFERRFVCSSIYSKKDRHFFFLITTSIVLQTVIKPSTKQNSYLSFFVLSKNVTFSIRVLLSLILPCSILFQLFLTVVFLVRVNSPKGQRKKSLILLFHPTSFVFFFFEDKGNDVMLGYVIMYATFVELML